MTKQEALSIINCDDISESIDAFDFEIFELKKKFLMVIPPIKIMQSLIKRFERLQLVSNTLDINLIQVKTETVYLNYSDLQLIDYLSEYHKTLSKFKLNISKSNHPKIIIQQINKLINLQTNLYYKLADIVKINTNLVEYEAVKLSEPIETFQLEQEIMNLTLHRKELSDYISKNKDTYIYKCILIANKQIKYNGLRREI